MEGVSMRSGDASTSTTAPVLQHCPAIVIKIVDNPEAKM